MSFTKSTPNTAKKPVKHAKHAHKPMPAAKATTSKFMPPSKGPGPMGPENIKAPMNVQPEPDEAPPSMAPSGPPPGPGPMPPGAAVHGMGPGSIPPQLLALLIALKHGGGPSGSPGMGG